MRWTDCNKYQQIDITTAFYRLNGLLLVLPRFPPNNEFDNEIRDQLKMGNIYEL